MTECFKRLKTKCFTRLEHLNFVLGICFGFRASQLGFLTAFIVLPFAAFLLGCGDSGPQRYDVSGEVTWEGTPLPDGDILLEPTDGGVPDHGKIVNGEFAFQATEGAKKVSIMATKAAAEVDPAMGAAPQVSYIPARYNVNTKLTADVKADGENRFSFALTEQE